MGAHHKSEIKSKIVMNSIITGILLLGLFVSQFSILRILAFVYLLFRFANLALERFVCTNCWKHVGIAAVIALLFAGIIPQGAFFVVIIFIWVISFL